MIAIVNAYRTPIGKFGGSLADVSPEDMVATIINNNLSSSGYGPSIVDQVIVGQTKQSAHAPNIARIAALKAGFQEEVTGHTVHMQCGSGLNAIVNAAMAIMTGSAEVVLAGGVESMSQAPYYFIGNRFGIKPGDINLHDSNTESQPRSQPSDRYGWFNMGQSAEWLAEKYGISRLEQDEFALTSQLRAKSAIEKNKFSEEIVPIPVYEGKKDIKHFAIDEYPRQTTIEKLSTLKAVFQKDGTVTAGNSSGRNDGAAMVLLMKQEKAEELGLRPMAVIRSFASAGVSPREMGIGPVPATKKALDRAGLKLEDMDLIELNEAFAAQSLAVLREWNISSDRVNVNGGAIALGHPLGCSGARILVTLLHELHKTGENYGLATLCVAGGQGISMVVERWNK